MSFGQGGPGWGPGGSGTPDWDALAADAEAGRARRRRWLMIGGGAVATLVVAAVVAVAVVAEGGGSSDPNALPTPEELPSSPAGPKPTFNTEAPPPPPNPTEFITDPEKDTAPISAKTLFPTAKVNSNGRDYNRRATASTEQCDAASVGDLSGVLTRNKCAQMHRATYTRDGIVVTVGIAVFPTQADAKKARDEAEASVAPLAGGGVGDFCRTSACRASAYTLGRYSYFTVAGYLDGTDVTQSETKALTSGRDIAGYAFQQLRKRGEDQADAAVTADPEG